MTELLHEWLFAYYSSSNFTCTQENTIFSSKINSDDVPALLQKASELSKFGFSPAAETVVVLKTHVKKDGVELPVSYSVSSCFSFHNGSTTLFVDVKGSGDDLEKAVANVIVSHNNLVYNNDPIEGGKGQIKRCKAVAQEIYEKHGSLLGCGCSVVVPYKTRGGRGGWKEKIAQRSFSFQKQMPA